MFVIEDNHLRISPEARDHFVVAYDTFGAGMAYSEETIIVFDDEAGTRTYSRRGASFRYLAGKFFIWKDRLYYSAYRLGKMRPASVQGFTEYFVWSDSVVFYLNGPIQGADAETFEPLGGFWARDAKSAFFQNCSVAGADVSTFRVCDEDYAVDKFNVYGFLGRVLAVYRTDPRSLGRGYFEVSGNVFFGSRHLPDAHLQSFRALPLISPDEKRQIWNSGGPKPGDESLAVSGFTAVDQERRYRGDWSEVLRKSG